MCVFMKRSNISEWAAVFVESGIDENVIVKTAGLIA